MRFRIRLLPICIVLAFAMLSLKAFDLGQGLTVAPGSVGIATVRAQSSALLPPPATVYGQAQTTSAGPSLNPQVAQAQPQQPPRPASGAGAAPARPGQPAAAATPTAGDQRQSRSSFLANQDEMTQAELDVLQRLSERRAALDQREQDLIAREALVKATERRAGEKISELQALQSQITALVTQHTDQEKQRLENLVKIYENMKPKDAAKIFEELDMLVMLDVIELMKERKVAPILASMNPNRAKEITVELANRRQLPVPKE